MIARLTLRFLGLISVAVLPCTDTWAQVPAGGEFQINTYTTGNQEPFPPRHAVAIAPNGNFVAVWMGDGVNGDGSLAGAFGQRFGSDGVQLGSEFRVNTFTSANQWGPSVAMDGKGGFVVVWHSDGQDGGDRGVFARRYDAAGSPRGAEFRVNTYTTGSQDYASVAAGSLGNFIVAWSSAGQDGSDWGVFGQRYDAAGAPQGVEFRINSHTTNVQWQPSVDLDGAGNLVVVWQSDQGGSFRRLFGQRFDARGTPVGAEFQVSAFASGSEPRVAVSTDGSFIVAWGLGFAPSVETQGIFARRFDRFGAPLGSDFLVNTYTTGTQWHTDVDADSDGNFVVVWEDREREQIFGRRYDSSGASRGGEFRVDASPFFSIYPSVASDPANNFVVTWASPDGDLFGVFGQRFGGLQPAALSVDASPSGTSNGNGIFEAGESVVVAPSWRNVNGAAQTFSGAASALTGPGAPGDPIYLIKNSSADYGTVANGVTASCTTAGDCYLVATTVPSTRPVRHWDASLREDILPVAQGQSRTWTLHIGDSFTDVLRSSGFYRFIETLMHRAVTAGCGPTQYCPGSSTAREQMAVFVLVAKEGAGYVPPACGATPMFADVPATNPFCRWIEELARRGVVGGCGGGNYCPTAPVSREQMSVFVLLTLDSTLNPPACSPPNIYNDVPETSPFCRWIEELTNRAVVSGCGGGDYCPTSAVTREQMGVFIAVTFGLVLYGP